MYNIVAEELQKEKPMFYTTYALTIDSVKNFFVNILRSSDVPIDYKHIVFYETSHTEQDVIDIFLRQYELAGYGYNSYYAQHSKGFTSSSPLPYFILTSEAAIFFSKDLQLFIVEKNDAHIGYTKEYFMNNLSHSLPFAFFMRDKEAFKLFTSLNPQITDESSYHHYDLSSNLCMASYLDAEILADSIPDEVEHKDYFVQGIAGFFNFYAQSPMTCTWDNDSLMNFVENDELICDYHNVTFDVFQISPKNKLKLLKKLKQNILEHNSNHFVVRELYMPSYFHINALGHNLVLGFNFKILDADNGKRYISTAVSQNPIIHKHLKNLTEYIIHSSYVYSNSRDYAIAQIDNAIFYYCRKHGFSTDDIM